MTNIWGPLIQELSLWRDHDLVLPFWWRDDDAVSVTPQLDRLKALSTHTNVPVHLAVVPKLLQSDLVDYLATHRSFVPLVHGWAHQNHAPADHKKAEFGDHRALDQALRDVQAAVARMQNLLGARFTPMFVPPWNRINPALLTQLPAAGIRAISTFTARKQPFAAPGLLQINTHLDPIAWKAGKRLADPETLISQLVGQLQDRRAGLIDTSEPLGLLTHHLVHDAEIWDFSERLLEVLCQGPIRLFDAHNTLTKDE